MPGPNAARGNLDLSPTDLGEMVRAVVETFSRTFTQKSINVHIHGPEGPVTVPVDRDRIARVLRNLTDNAARYTPQKGEVEIGIDPHAGQVRIYYTNSVEELIPKDLPHLFERFYRGEKSRSRQHGGAGIGLSMVKELVEAHGGTVGAELVDGRICIWFELPLDPPP